MSETVLQINFKFEGSKADYLKAFREVYGSATRERIRTALHDAFVNAIHGD